jgi:hypothetical protein
MVKKKKEDDVTIEELERMREIYVKKSNEYLKILLECIELNPAEANVIFTSLMKVQFHIADQIELPFHDLISMFIHFYRCHKDDKHD